MSKFCIDMISSYLPCTVLVTVPPPAHATTDTASILQRVKEAYLLWLHITSHIAKGQRYTIGNRIENKFLDLLELSYITYFTPREQKVGLLDDCIFLLDTLKFLIHTTWEAKIISHSQYAGISQKLEEVGRMFGGWKKKLENPDKKNHTL